MNISKRLTPKNPEEIEPLIVATDEPLGAGSDQLLNHGNLSLMREFKSRSMLAFRDRHDHSRLWGNGGYGSGPLINKFYLLSTLVGPEGEIRKDKKPKRIGSYSYSHLGLTMTAQMYDSRFDFSRTIVDIAFLPPDKNETQPNLIQFLAKGIFELLNNEDPSNRVTPNDITSNGLQEYAVSRNHLREIINKNKTS